MEGRWTHEPGGRRGEIRAAAGRPRLACAATFLGALAGALLLQPAARAQEAPGGGGGGGGGGGVSGGVSGDGAAAAAAAAVDAFLASGEASLPAVRTFLVDLEAALGTVPPGARTALRASSRQRLLDGLARLLEGDQGRARALLARAEDERREARQSSLEKRLLCWCPEETWTRTIQGCPEPCAEPQRALIRQWLAEGLTDDEILARMVADPRGGPQVLAEPPATLMNVILGYAVPVLIGIPALLLVGWFLLRAVAGGRAARGDGSRDSRDSGDEDGLPGEDEALAARIEEELKEMDT